MSLLLGAFLIGLLLCSASLSSSETAFFSLAPHERKRAGERTVRLFEDSRGLLVTLLLGNLVVNLLYFTFSGRLVADSDGPLRSAAIGFLSLVALLVFGEILPKVAALRGRVWIARVASGPISVMVALLLPVRRLLLASIEVLYRALGTRAQEEVRVSTEVLASALERSAQAGEIQDLDAELAVEILELRGIRVREIMRPRVDMRLLDRRDPDRDAIVDAALAAREPVLVVCDGSPDAVLGSVHLRQLLLDRTRAIEPILEPVVFVPEVASVLDLLRELRAHKAAEAVVVDEWGGTAGWVTLEHVFEEIVGDLRSEGEVRAQPVVPLGEGRFRVSGQLPIRDWNQLFGSRIVPTEFETLGGFVTALLGRIPRAGDEVTSGGLVYDVHQTRGRRIVTVDVAVLARGDDDAGVRNDGDAR